MGLGVRVGSTVGRAVIVGLGHGLGVLEGVAVIVQSKVGEGVTVAVGRASACRGPNAALHCRRCACPKPPSCAQA